MALLAATEQAVFHIGDLATILGIANENTLRVTLHRLVRDGILHRIRRGLFSTIPIGKIHPVVLGNACLHRYAYLSTESVLRDEGYIVQSVDTITFVSGVSRRFEVCGQRFVSRRLHARFLHNQEGIIESGCCFRAQPERAIADMLYFDPWYHFDRPVDWDAIRVLQQKIGYPLTPHRYVDPA
jgi:predicted transcriptional regulator of viral defense system